MPALLLCLLLLPLAACHPPPAAWNASSATGPVLCGTVRDPQGRPLPGVTVRPHAGFATRFPGEAVRTDAAGRYRIEPVRGSLMDDGLGGWDIHVGVCVGELERDGNPPEFLPWKDVRLPQAPGTVVVLDFVLDPAAPNVRMPGE